MRNTHILIADDDEGDRKHIRRSLKQAAVPWLCTETSTVQEALDACARLEFDCAVIDYHLPGLDGLAGITGLHDCQPYMAIIMSTGQGDETIAVEAMKRGALDYLPKAQINAGLLRHTIERAIERAALQQQLDRQREELVNFSRVLVHDFKAPVQAVQGLAQIIEMRVQHGQFDTVPDYCRRVVRSVQRMTALIDTLHAHTTLEEPVPHSAVAMNAVADDVAAILLPLTAIRAAQISHGELPVVNGNAPQLLQLLQNLIGNGIKYCKADVASVHVEAQLQDDQKWRFSVRDNGIGMAEKDCEKVFEPFKRLHGMGEYEGTGLGLATCRKIVERHHGEIWCESKLGEGSTFFFTLPAANGL